MCRKSIYPGILIVVLLALSSLLFLSGPRSSVKAQSTNTCCGLNPPTAPRELDFPYYSLRDGFTSTLNLVSDSPKPLDFIIALHSLDGETLLSSSMTIQPSAKLPIDLATLIKGLGSDPTGAYAEGSISIYFTGTIMPLVGQLTLTNPALKLVHETEMVENDPGRSDIPPALSGIWWGLSGGRDARIMVANMSGNLVTADVFLDFAGQRQASSPLVFNPHETKVLSVAQMLGDLKASVSQAPQGGLTIVQRGSHPSLIAQGKVTDPVTGFSTTLEFPDPARQPASALHAVGLPIGTPPAGTPYAGAGSFTPHIIARNLLDKPQSMTVTVEYPKSATWNSTNGPGGSATPDVRVVGRFKKSAKNPNEALNHPPNPDPSMLTGQFTLAPVVVGAYDTVDDSLAAAMNQLPLPLAYCSVRIQYSGAPGSMIAQVSSVDAKQDLVVDAKTMNEGDGWAGSGANPWHLDANTQSVLFLTDESDEPARIGFSITVGYSHFYLTSLKLAPHETRAIDIRQLRGSQKPDFFKTTIPADATDGSVNWVRIDNVPVSGRVVVISRSGGIVSSYDCCSCPCPDDFANLSIDPTSFAGVPGDWWSAAGLAWYDDCNGNGYSVDETSNMTWSTTNTSIATASVGEVDLLAGGSCTVNVGNFSDCVYDLTPCDCDPTPGNGSAACKVQVPAYLSAYKNTCGTIQCDISGVLFSTDIRLLRYQVLDSSKQAVAVAGLTISEYNTNFSDIGCNVSAPANGSWLTDIYGNMNADDGIATCSLTCDQGGSCSASWNQSVHGRWLLRDDTQRHSARLRKYERDALRDVSDCDSRPLSCTGLRRGLALGGISHAFKPEDELSSNL